MSFEFDVLQENAFKRAVARKKSAENEQPPNY